MRPDGGGEGGGNWVRLPVVSTRRCGWDAVAQTGGRGRRAGNSPVHRRAGRMVIDVFVQGARESVKVEEEGGRGREEEGGGGGLVTKTNTTLPLQSNPAEGKIEINKKEEAEEKEEEKMK